MAQKAKVRWAIEGDENSKFFHGIINKKRSQLAIRGVLIEGNWIDKPCDVKNEIFNHFSNRFAKPSGPYIELHSSIFKKLSAEHIVDLECDVTYDEIKKAVWDCGTYKSPGPDRFTFDFIRTFWQIINQDVVNAVRDFFITSKFPPGCNSSFIALIPKKQDVKFVKDFRPISLIGCFYKIIAKILANRLNMVIFDLISDVQSAFRRWIQGFLSSSMGSILVNGSPTSEFQFHKGLKQRDPLSPYRFILVTESLHLSFTNILNACLFKGIRIDDTLTLSHFYYVDDAVFIGKWERANVITIVRMLSCFFMALGLQINIHKSKLIGISVSIEEVNAAANIIGCSTFSTPFTYLGVKVGMSSSRKKYWDEVIGKISARLSKWKLKTLSIGGRLTLIKSVLTSLPLNHVSLYKAPLGVLHDLESFRRKFFNGIDENERKISMIGWNKILALKKGGLGVSSFFFALNRSLLFKWVCRFLFQGSSLWYRFISALYGKHISFDCTGSVSHSSTWNCIIRELGSLSSKGINLLVLLKKKMGNGAHTFFGKIRGLTIPLLAEPFLELLVVVRKKINSFNLLILLILLLFLTPMIDGCGYLIFLALRGGAEEDQFIQLVDLIDSITISNSNDRWVWLLESSSEFSVHSARTYIDNLLLPMIGSPTRWVKVVSIKINIFAWKIYLDKLPTRSLLFKWVWRFLSQGSSLWYRFISALYGKRISFDCIGSVSCSSTWNCIIKELGSLSSKGINLLALLKKKVGNGAHTFFWEDTWINDTPLSRTFPRLYE
nr:RNA-directed DNA polymerase, eukaryota [Tanacetum cinerariifolium]